MKKLILGELKHDKKMVKIIDESFKKAEEVLQKEAVNLEDDLVFLQEYYSRDVLKIQYQRGLNHILFFMGQGDYPVVKNVAAIVVRACFEQFIDKKCAGNFKDEFLYDLCRLGSGLWLVDRYFGNDFLKLTKKQLNEAKNEAKKALKNNDYDETFWFSSDDENGGCIIWSFGAEIIKGMNPKNIKDILTISEQDLSRAVSDFVGN